MYTKAFYKFIENKYAQFSAVFADAVMALYSPVSVADAGCGTGIYLKQFYSRNIQVSGFDSSPEAVENTLIPIGCIVLCDLSKPIPWHGDKFDICISFETAEHIDPAAADIFVQNLTSLSDRIIFSAAPPGQGGTGHINEQPREYWTDAFALQGYIHTPEETENIRFIIETLMTPESLEKIYPYINMMVFDKKTVTSPPSARLRSDK